MKISERSISALARIITGDADLSPYRSGPRLVRFFNEFGRDDRYPSGGGFPSRWQYAEDCVRSANGTQNMVAIIEEALHPRNFIDTEFDPLIAVDHVNRFLSLDGFEAVVSPRSCTVRKVGGSSVELSEPQHASDPHTREFIEEQLDKCHQKLGTADYGGAITNARSLVEAVLVATEKELDPNAPAYDGKLPQLYKRVQRLLNLDPAREASTSLQQILTGLSSLVAGLSGMRNKMSDSHAQAYRPKHHHARLAVNSAKTLVDFVWSTRDYQQSRGSLRDDASTT